MNEIPNENMEDIKAGVNLLTRRSLNQTYVTAERQEDALGTLISAISKKCNNPSSLIKSNPSLPTQATLALPASPPNHSKIPKSPPSGTRHLSSAEQLERRAKNLCFNYDEQSNRVIDERNLNYYC